MNSLVQLETWFMLVGLVAAEEVGMLGMEVESGEQREVFSIEVEHVVVDQAGELIVLYHIDGEQMDVEQVGVELVVLGLTEEAEARAHHQCKDLAVEVAATAEARVRPTFHQAQVQVFLQVKVEVEAVAGAGAEAIEKSLGREE